MMRISNYIRFLPVLFLTVFALLAGNITAQEGIVCYSCGKRIAGEYIEVDGRKFHKSHFTCAKCNKPISGAYSEKEGRFYHPDCYAEAEGLICSYCKKTIRGEYALVSGNKYHRECYQDNVAAKCAVCSKPLMSEYAIDIYGNKFHSFHEVESDRCNNCKRIISEATTGGGRHYTDGRHICRICYSGSVTSEQMIDALLNKVVRSLKSMGFSFNEKSIAIRGVDRKELMKVAGRNYNPNMHGFCQTTSVTSYLKGKNSGTKNSHKIYVLNGVPAIYIESVIAHELMHVWLNDNTNNNHTGELREGSCNYISYVYLKTQRDERARQLIKMLENESDDDYGKGFLKVRDKFQDENLSRLFQHLRKNRNI